MEAIAWAAFGCTIVIGITVYNCWDRWLDYKAERHTAEREQQQDA